eukprot:CAMPEP_0198727996 /NCGR_PEP_ID=MMETSP1475-20131203/6666_1 /TAXON_ID= ORGANISM="Unidentified sp., Strain CCMP1999" /NCGR_SAMPLE_ID=MMETSP1475 /ASSEMBLY_ACC=CAM_ASM_001111 /LENGTH=242 /DNA_ID=CAMNT_0044490235 /DNA_START=286 /DNA_END=1014 /DNA_ORIENTATION=-
MSSSSESRPAKIEVRITSDNICPWCFVGKRSIEQASKHFGDELDVTIKWYPFYLAPGWPDEGVVVNTKNHLNKHFGGGAFEGLVTNLGLVNEHYGLGIKWNINDSSVMFNTRASHTLLAAAGTQSNAVQNRLIELLFQKYFERNEDLRHIDDLEKAGREAGIGEELIHLWKVGKFDDIVRQQTESNAERGVKGVPYFEIWMEGENTPVVLCGGQSPKAFIEAFDTLLSASEEDYGLLENWVY